MKSFVTILCVLAALVVALGWYEFVGPGYYRQMTLVKQAIHATPGLSVVTIAAIEDITLEEIWATFELQGRGTFSMYDVTPETFTGSDHFVLCAIGPYKFRHEREGFLGHTKISTGEPVRSKGYGSMIDIGLAGGSPRKPPFAIRTMQDFIAHYDDVLRFFDDWHKEGIEISHVDSRGISHLYAIEKKEH